MEKRKGAGRKNDRLPDDNDPRGPRPRHLHFFVGGAGGGNPDERDDYASADVVSLA